MTGRHSHNYQDLFLVNHLLCLMLTQGCLLTIQQRQEKVLATQLAMEQAEMEMRNEKALYKEAEDARLKKKQKESILDEIVSQRKPTVTFFFFYKIKILFRSILIFLPVRCWLVTWQRQRRLRNRRKGRSLPWGPPPRL